MRASRHCSNIPAASQATLKKSVRLIRKTGREFIYNVGEFDMSSFHIADGDSVRRSHPFHVMRTWWKERCRSVLVNIR